MSWELVDGKWLRTTPLPDRPPSKPTPAPAKPPPPEADSGERNVGYKGSVKKSILNMNATADEHTKRASTMHRSPNYVKPHYDPRDPDYGRPEKGSKTERRGIKAGNYVMREVLFLCEIIEKYGKRGGDELVEIEFGRLFDLYAAYSDKVVGMLLRARKYGLLTFEGEMLYQRQDDAKIIKMLKPLSEIQASVKETNDPKQCMTATNSSPALLKSS